MIVVKAKQKPLPWARVRREDLKGIRGVCLDIDDTLSTHGKLTDEAYAALWELKERGFWVVPLTGRPAGWCDMIARFWPVDAVVGENGAFTFSMNKGRRIRLDTPFEMKPAQARAKLAKLRAAILRAFPDARFASDQAYREFDLAVDFCEDVRPWPEARVQKLLQFCERAGAHAKLSSIHVNTWFGSYDKLTGFRHWLSKTPRAPRLESWLFIGDSPNDEPLFRGFSKSVGVANLKRYLPRLQNAPTWMTSKACGAGFAEMARVLVKMSR